MNFVDFAVPSNPIIEMKGSEKIEKHLDFTRDKNTEEHTCNGDVNYIWCTWNSPQKAWQKARMN